MSNNKKISQLGLAGGLTGSELVPVVKAGVTVQTTTQDIADLGTPPTPTLQQVITESATVTGTLAQSADTLTKKEINDNQILDTSSNGTDISTRDLTPIAITDTVNTTAHVINDGVIENTTASLTKNGVEVATVNDIPTVDTTIIDGSTNPVAGNAVFDALALKKDTYTIPLLTALLNPADATVYYFDNITTPTTTAADHYFKLGYNATIIGAFISVVNTGTAGSTQSSVLEIYNNTSGTTSNISSAITTNASTTVSKNFTITGLTISVAANDDICIKWTTPTWTTNPTSVGYRLTLIIERL
jgi:hypothetical protein